MISPGGNPSVSSLRMALFKFMNNALITISAIPLTGAECWTFPDMGVIFLLNGVPYMANNALASLTLLSSC